MAFQTKCLKCGGPLYLIAGTFRTRILIHPDGWVLSEEGIDTDNEVIQCGSCGWEHKGLLCTDEEA